MRGAGLELSGGRGGHLATHLQPASAGLVKAKGAQQQKSLFIKEAHFPYPELCTLIKGL